MQITRRLLCAAALTFTAVGFLSSCGKNSGSAANPPTDFTVTQGHDSIVANWTPDSGAQYWVFIGPPGTSPDNFSRTANARAFVNVTPPLRLSALLNALALYDGNTYDVSINARTSGGEGGSASFVRGVVPRAPTSWVQQTKLGTTDLTSYSTGFNTAVTSTRLAVITSKNGVAYTGTIASNGYNYSFTPTTVATTATNPNLNGSAFYSAYGFLVVGDSGAASLSADGITWTAQTSGFSTRFNSASNLTNVGYLVAGDNCTLAQVTGGGSSQTTVWTDLSAGVRTVCNVTGTNSVYSAVLGTYNGLSYYVVGGDQGLLAYSNTPTSTPAVWTKAVVNGAAAPANLTIRSIFYGGYTPTGGVAGTPIFIATGFTSNTSGGTTTFTPVILSSTDLANWTSANLPSGLTGRLFGISGVSAAATGSLVKVNVVGDNGLILTSDVSNVAAGGALTFTQYTASATTNNSLFAIGTEGFGFYAVGAAANSGTNILSSF